MGMGIGAAFRNVKNAAKAAVGLETDDQKWWREEKERQEAEELARTRNGYNSEIADAKKEKERYERAEAAGATGDPNRENVQGGGKAFTRPQDPNKGYEAAKDQIQDKTEWKNDPAYRKGMASYREYFDSLPYAEQTKIMNRVKTEGLSFNEAAYYHYINNENPQTVSDVSMKNIIGTIKHISKY